MGEMIAVWSPFKKTGKTILLYQLTDFFIKHAIDNIRLLSVDVNLQYGNLLELHGISRQSIQLDDLVNIQLASTQEINIIETLARGKGQHFLGNSKSNSLYIHKNLNVYEKLFDQFTKSYDAVFVDTVSGWDNPLTNMILEKCSRIICVIEQDCELLDRYPFVKEKNMAVIINNYDENTYPCEKELVSNYGIKNVFTLPYCSLLRTMKNKNLLHAYSETESVYLKDFTKFGTYVGEVLKLPLHMEQNEKKRKSLLGRICFQ